MEVRDNMGLMGTLREGNRVILWILLITFVGSLAIGGVLGGADILDIITGRSKYIDAVAIVNGESIKSEDYFNFVNLRYDQVRSQGDGEITDAVRVQVGNEVWNELITEKLIMQEIDKRNIRATDEEVVWHMTENPPSYFRQDTIFQTNGKFDMNKYRQALSNPGYNWRIYEDDIRRSLPRQKIINLLASTIRVSKEDVRQYYKRNKLRYYIRYVTVDNSLFLKDSTISISQSEIEEFYNASLENYKKEPERIMSYAWFSKLPSAEDTAMVMKEALGLKARAESGIGFAELAKAYSDGPSASEGGNLGYFGRGVMVKTFEDAVFGAKIGDIVAPVLTEFGVHVIYIKNKRTSDKGVEEIEASHILLELRAGPNTLSNSRSIAKLFAYDANEMEFEAAAEENDAIVQKTDPIKNSDINLGNVGPLTEAVIFAFTSEEGDVSEVLENESGYYVFRLDVINEASIQQLEEVSPLIKKTLEFKKRNEKALAYAQELYGKALLSNMSLEYIVELDSKLSIKTSPPFYLNSNIPGLGKSGELAGRLSIMEPGNLTRPILITSKVVIAQLVSKDKFIKPAFKILYQELQQQLLVAQQNTIFSDWIEDLKGNAEIIDLRNKRLDLEHDHL
ncbi:MAG: SurA N-terminal domain-containing protein [Candidatus Marinimicrobia bacterium]|nr:SurA N-terminal domain-containing protein [Candidatus Neomarinimicrobiota bacterium]